jgi:hypothetical protein
VFLQISPCGEIVFFGEIMQVLFSLNHLVSPQGGNCAADEISVIVAWMLGVSRSAL